MSGEERRDQILQILKESDRPVSGTALAKLLAVSRQVIVQDMALLRAQNKEILSTYKGYMIKEGSGVCRVFHVRHTDEEILEELNTIVDEGGKVVDVYVDHPVYGRLSAPIGAYSRADVQDFMDKMKNGAASPLKNVTEGEHYHTVTGYSEDILDKVENALKKKHFLIP